MKSARSGSSAFGIVAGAALVSSGIVGGLLGGGTAAEAATVNPAATNVCGQPPARTSAARSVPASQTAIVMDAVSLSSAKTPKPTATKSSSSPSPSASASQSATAKATSSATATAKATSSDTATSSATATAKATSSATPKATDSASATPSSTASASSSASASPSSSASATPSPTPTGSGSASPSPSPTGSSPSAQLCLKVQPITTKSGVHPGGTGSYAIWVWPAGGAASGVTVTISGKVASKAVAPKFTVCPTASGRTCKVGGIAKGTSDELQATIAVPSGTAGKQATLTATAKSSNASAPPAAAGAIKITAKPSAKHSPSPSPTPTPTSTSTGTGLGATLPAGILPTVPSALVPGVTLGELPAPTTSAGSPGGLFPTVSPQPSPSPYSAVLPNARGVRVTDAAATFPFSTRLVGGELVGLAVLAAALAIAIVRFSLRRPRAQHGKDAAS